MDEGCRGCDDATSVVEALAPGREGIFPGEEIDGRSRDQVTGPAGRHEELDRFPGREEPTVVEVDRSVGLEFQARLGEERHEVVALPQRPVHRVPGEEPSMTLAFVAVAEGVEEGEGGGEVVGLAQSGESGVPVGPTEGDSRQPSVRTGGGKF